jgi:signal transduction histidine kinase
VDLEVSADLLDETVSRGQSNHDDTPGAPRPAAAASRAYLEELFEAFQSGFPTLASASSSTPSEWRRVMALGNEWHSVGGDLIGLVRETARLGRALEETLEDKGRLDVSARRRLRPLADEAAARAADAYEAASRGRRDRWLSYFSHEMRNSLNTLVNAHWILRNSEGKNTMKVCDMAERAVRKLEGFVKDFRDLETQVQRQAPGRPDLHD